MPEIRSAAVMLAAAGSGCPVVDYEVRVPPEGSTRLEGRAASDKDLRSPA
jgi:hypothetical protein